MTRAGFLCVCLFSIGAFARAASAATVTLDFGMPSGKQLNKLIPETFVLRSVTFKPDSKGEVSELELLLGVKPGLVSRVALEKGIERLFKKQKFKQLIITAHHAVADGKNGYHVTIETVSFWTFSHIQMRGGLFGRDRYKEFYPLAPGEPFDEKKHKAGVEKIKQELAAAGFFNAQITDSFSYNTDYKTVSVALALESQRQFIIDEVRLCLNVPDELNLQDFLQENLMGQEYSKKLVNDETRHLHDHLINKGYLHSTIELEEELDSTGFVRLTFHVNLASKNSFEFHGNHFFSRRALLDQILLFGKSAELIPPSLIAEEFIALYKKMGFWCVEVTWQEDGERIFFFIKEGKRVGVSRVEIEGVTAFDQAALVIKHFSPLLKAKYFDESLLKQGLDSLGAAYLACGFWDVKIENYDYVLQPDGAYLLQIKVSEGPQRFLAGVTVPTVYELTSLPTLCAYGSLRQAVPFDIDIIQLQRKELTKALQKNGYLYLRPRPHFTDGKNGIQLSWEFTGNSQKVHFGDTILIGNGKLPAHILLRELAYNKGDVWDQRKIEQSVTRLKGLGVFDVVALAPEDLSSAEAEKTLLLKYSEDTPYEVRARLGIQGVNRNIVHFSAQGLSYKAGGSFLYKNPFNIGDYFRFDIDFSRFIHDIVATYHVPWLFNRPIRTDFKAYSSRDDQPVVIGNADVLYRAAQDGALMGMTRQFDTFDIGVNVGVEWMSIKPSNLLPATRNVEKLSRAIQLDRRLINHTFPYFFFEPTFYRSSLDNKIQPTRGWLTVISAKTMLPPTLADTAFIKFILEQSVYFPLPIGKPDPWVLALRGRCGTIFNDDFKRIIPIERFFLGGAFSLRSYEPDLVPPLNPLRDCNGKKRLVPIGGKSMLNLNAEVRFPIYGSVSGVTFLDFGALSTKGIHAVALNNVVGAAGVGLRLNTVVGPLRFDIGWKLNKPKPVAGIGEPRSYAWFLTLGNAF